MLVQFGEDLYNQLMKIFMWFIMHDKLNTKSRLKWLKVLSEEATVMCPLCENEEETISHAFLHCIQSNTFV
jgi:hypothetical protein